MKLRIKYCGGCNPNINRTKIKDEIINLLNNTAKVTVVDNNADVGIVIAGCSVCCVNMNEIEDQARCWVIIGGNLVNHRQVPPDQISKTVVSKILP